MWKTIRQFGEQHGITPAAVKSRIKTGSLKSRKNKGHWEVFDEDAVEVSSSSSVEEIDAEYTSAMTKKTELENKLKEQKLKNLQQDTLLKQQKNRDFIESMRREFAEGVFDCFTDTFDDVKNLFIDLKLNKEQNQKLKSIFGKAIKRFNEKLIKYLEDNANKKDEEK